MHKRKIVIVLSVALLLFANLAAILLLTKQRQDTKTLAATATSWKRSALIYHDQNRTTTGWQKHMMRIDKNGAFTGQWLFDAAILTTQKINGKDIMYANLTGTDLNDLLNQTFTDATQLNNAVKYLGALKGNPTKSIKVFITFPWLSPKNYSVQLPGSSTIYTMSNQTDRLKVANWYLDQVKKRALASGWKNLTLQGIYYHREDAPDAWGDPAFIKQLNIQIHNRNMSSLWIPYYDAPYAWNGTDLGFDTVVVQPAYSFRSIQYKGDVNGSRLYSAGYKAAGKGQAIEYEISSAGKTKVENWLAHQYLAVSQFTGASAYPQVFFVGLTGDLFDQIVNQSSAQGDTWWAYSDLTNYLVGQNITNLEVAIPWQPTTNSDGTLQQIWIPSSGTQLTSIRLDFNDRTLSSPWRGRITVTVEGPGGKRTAYAQRAGIDNINTSYNSVFVPLPVPADGNKTVTKVTIIMSRESGSPWPNVQRFIGAQYEHTIVANGNYQENSTSTTNLKPGPYPDSVNSHIDYAAGKLTDGLKSPTGGWNWNGIMGWEMYDERFSVTIDLGQKRTIGSVTLTSHLDQSAGINWPRQIAAAVASYCEPRFIGTITESCVPTGSSGTASTTTKLINTSTLEQAGNITLQMQSVLGRYVTITGICSGWCLFDEIEVKDQYNKVLSKGRPYILTPIPSTDTQAYADDSRRLVDGAIVPNFEFQFASMIYGIPSNQGGQTQVVWNTPRNVRSISVWMTPAVLNYGIVTPSKVTIQWRDQYKVWQTKTAVTTKLNCKLSACANLNLPTLTKITGIRAVFHPETTWKGWYMISEITTQPYSLIGM